MRLNRPVHIDSVWWVFTRKINKTISTFSCQALPVQYDGLHALCVNCHGVLVFVYILPFRARAVPLTSSPSRDLFGNFASLGFPGPVDHVDLFR